ncbi:hypothetical protein [Lichenicoccus roseus]|uniref:Uncharacterized protein n=1 Tax=Lichenicoccus roseus TaxID=2683649 RepID=A0A5R9J4S6_9PROT|nr:hypothetical protein [Lichenicoccus roseus]TLU72630.1 hypothetical protein FE263_11355 [Lichenicoccus roseus]
MNVPFTTPGLFGTRIRIGSGGILEGIVPSPSGRGVYVLPWDQVGSLCQRTIFDQQLMSRLGVLSTVSPAVVRNQTWQAAVDGLAGRPAILAAQAGLAAADTALVQAQVFLRCRLQGAPGPEAAAPLASRPSVKPQAGAAGDEAVTAFAGRHGLQEENLALALQTLASNLADLDPAGRTAGSAAGSLAGRIARLGALRDALRHDAGPAPSPRYDTRRVAALIDLLLDNVTMAMAKTAVVINMPDLIRIWMKSPEPLRAILSQPDWLLDGWDQLDAGYRLATMGRSTPVPVSRLIALLPPMPASEPRTAEMFKARQIILQESRHLTEGADDTRPGRSGHDQVARGEAVLAMLS